MAIIKILKLLPFKIAVLRFRGGIGDIIPQRVRLKRFEIIREPNRPVFARRYFLALQVHKLVRRDTFREDKIAVRVQHGREKQRMEEELAIARDLQTSMLPAACPEIKGFKIAALSIPAREVGGDFFDFIQMGEERVGLVIGDVTGKSVSGALVMSASRSIFRMLSEEEMSVAEIMTRANRRTKKDIKSGMFVALLYAVLNSKNKTLSLCSAGQTQPIYLSTKSGVAELVQTEGDTFPLGIFEDTEYQETRLELSPGDKVVFYTDGIVEAMNEQKEIFGFDRLQEVVQAARSTSTETLLKKILNSVNQFVGNAPQHDDLTVIVVNVSQ